MPPTPCLRGQGTSPGSTACFLCLSGLGKHPPLLSCSSSLWSRSGPPVCLSSSPWPPSYAPRTNMAVGRGSLEGTGSSWELSRPPHARVGRVTTLHSSPPPPGGPLCLSLLFSPWPPSYAPRTHTAWRGLWIAGDWPGSSAGSLA